ncbi:MAG: aminotransferase class I/II-fold pyridoxal phosphate-dependent enzyme [Nitrospinae bacterium]|nr:aminotransferase class I/II-fold pyridoxal phosphate-dependent enzyme [Nitrospinota bacterium]
MVKEYSLLVSIAVCSVTLCGFGGCRLHSSTSSHDEHRSQPAGHAVVEENRKIWTFEDSSPNGIPAYLSFPTGSWRIQKMADAPSSQSVLFQKAKNSGSYFNLAVIQDAAYAALTYNGKPLSFLSVPGAMEVGVEFHSLSKAYNMTGWRIAFIVGNELVVKGFAHVKDNVDSGQFAAIQKAGVYALDHPEITREILEKYRRRLILMVDVLNSVGFNATLPGGSFFLYVKAPKGIEGGEEFNTAEDFSQFLIKEMLISTVPWDNAGNYVRFSATFAAKDTTDETRIMQEIKNRLSSVKFVF